MKKKNIFFALLSLTLSSLIALGIAEIVLRKFFRRGTRVYRDERSLAYRYDKRLGWFPLKSVELSFKRTRMIHIKHNSLGFRDPEHVVDPNKPRMIFVGDSFVWGYDVEKEERFIEKLRPLLPEWSLYNLGISGYGTDQEYLLLQQYFEHYAPHIVFLIFCGDNDEKDNSSNARYNGYFKPYFVQKKDEIQLQGIPVPKTRHYFFAEHPYLSHSYVFRVLVNAYCTWTLPEERTFKNPTQTLLLHMQRFVEENGSEFIVELQDARPTLKVFLNDQQISYVDLRNPHI